MKHAKEPWCVIGVDNNYEIFSKSEDYDVAWSIDSEANAERIVACVNACKGITSEALENGVVLDSVKLHEAILDQQPSSFFKEYGMKVWEGAE